MPPPSPEAQPKPRSRLRRIWSLGHGTCRLAWRLFLIHLCLMLYLWLIGLPGFLVNPWLREMDTRPFRVGLGRIILDPTEGVVISGLYLYHDQDFSEPMARLSKVTLHPDWQQIRRGRPALSSLTLDKGSLRFPAWTRSNAPPVRLAAREINAHIELHPDRIEFSPLRLQLFGVQWHGTGAVLRLPGGGGPFFVWKELDRAWTGIAQAPPATAEVADLLNGLRFEPLAQARVGFRFDPARNDGWKIHVLGDGQATHIRGAWFDRVHAEAAVDGYRIDLTELTLGAQDRRGHLTGKLDLVSRELSARLFSDLPPAPWIAIMPQAWRDELQSTGLSVAGSMKSEVWIGPAPLEEIAQHLHGWIALEEAQLRGIPLEKGYFSMRVEGPNVYFDDVSAIVGRSQGRGPLGGRATWNRASNEITGTLEINFDPNLVQPVLTPRQQTFARRFTFPDQPPHFAGTFRRRGGEDPELVVTGRLWSGACTYRDIPLTSVVATLSVDQDVVALAPWSFSQETGSINGWLRYNMADHLVHVDLAGDMDPHAVAGLVGPGLRRVLAPTRYEGPVFMHARGQVDTADDQQRTDLHLHAEGQRMGVSNWLADTASFDLQARGGEYVTTNVAGTAFGGDFTARVRVGPDPGASGLAYQVSATVTNAELARLVAQVTTNLSIQQQGKIQLAFEVSGPAEGNLFRDMKGKGDVHVEEGAIMRLRLFGGLSRLLSAIYPGLGFAAQDDLHAHFTIGKGRITTRDAWLQGSVLSMKADGYYQMDGAVQFKVEVKLLRKGVLASLLRLITLPVTKLLIFQLSGTLDDPHWRPVNLPKELFLIFE